MGAAVVVDAVRPMDAALAAVEDTARPMDAGAAAALVRPSGARGRAGAVAVEAAAHT